MNYLIFAVLLYLGIGLQSGFLSTAQVFGGTLNLAIVVLIPLVFLNLEREGFLFSIILAFFWDLYQYSFVLLSIFAIIIIYVLLLLFKSKVSDEPNYAVIAMAAFIGSFIFDLMQITSLALAGKTIFTTAIITYALPNALIALIFSIPIFALVGLIVRILKLYQVIKAEEGKIKV